MDRVETDERKPRSDALRNRERLIESAKEVLGRGGPDASLEAVARHAGVGIGTLYRHFPTREALFQAVYRHEVEQMIALAATLERAPDGLAALRAWLHAYVALVATKRGLLGALAVVVTEDSKTMYAELGLRVTAAVERLLQQAMARGEIRKDITAEDLLQTVYAFCAARPATTGWEGQVLRLLDVFVDGLTLR